MQIVGRTAKVDSAMAAAVEIQSWLEDIGLDRYADVFRDNNIGFSRLRLMSSAELSKLGISPDHQRILLSAAVRNGIPIPKTSGPVSSEHPLGLDATTGSVERRQLTVMFCDIAGFAELSTRLDPGRSPRTDRSQHRAARDHSTLWRVCCQIHERRHARLFWISARTRGWRRTRGTCWIGNRQRSERARGW